MSNVIYNNFTAGLVTPKLAGNYSSQVYHNGCAVLENFAVMLQGGITRRPPLEAGFQVPGESRIIPFIISADEAYILVLTIEQSGGTTVGRFYLKGMEDGQWTTKGSGSSPYTTKEELAEVQFAQSADVLYLAQPDHRPQKLYYDDSAQPAVWQMSGVNARLTRYQDTSGAWLTFDPLDEYEDSGTATIDSGGHIFRTAGRFPAVVAFVANRLWFACSDSHVNRYWASRPYDHEKFEFFKMVKVVDDTLTAEELIGMITTDEYSDQKTYALGDRINRGGYIYECISAIVTAETWNPAHWKMIGSADVEAKYKYQDTVTEDCGIRNDACGNDAIRWISAKNNIIVGTASGEYVIPGTVNGINFRIDDLSSFGSAKDAQAVQANGEVIYIQCGARRLRSITASADGFSSLDLTYQCDRLLAEHGGAVRMAWRRVPDPTLYVVLGDGTLAVLFYERNYGLCAWAHWSFLKAQDSSELALIRDVVVIDTPVGQEAYLLVKRGGDYTVEHISSVDASESINTSYKDLGTIPYVSEMKTNPYEYNASSYGSSLGKKLRIRAMRCRAYMTKAFLAGYDERYMKPYSGSTDLQDIEILLSGGYGDFVQMMIRSVEDKPLSVLAFSLDLEAER